MVLTAVAVLLTSGASAQVSEDRDLGGDLRRDLQGIGPEVPPTPGTSAPGKDFQFVLTAPVLFTDNALQTTGDIERRSPRGDVHFNPDVLLKWSHQFERFKVSTAVDASVDRFFSETDEDEDTFFGSLKLSLTDGRSSLFVPYVAYAVTADLRPNFAEPDDVLHDFSVGASSGIGFDAGGNLIQFRNAVHPGDRAAAFELSAGRRTSDPHDFQNSFAVALVDITYVATSTWTLGLRPKLRVRWYDEFEGAFRRDLRLTTVLKAAWTPDWLTRVIPSAELDFTISFLKNYSTLARERFDQWEGGPSLSLAWRF